MKTKLLKQKDFLFLVIGSAASTLGSEMQSFILSLYVLGITGLVQSLLLF